MDANLASVLSGFELRASPTPEQLDLLIALARSNGVALPRDYRDFMAAHDGGDGDIGTIWVQFWPIERILETASRQSTPYADVMLFAGDGGNTIYGFDSRAGGEIVEGDWIGLERDELHRHGESLASMAASLIARS